MGMLRWYVFFGTVQSFATALSRNMFQFTSTNKKINAIADLNSTNAWIIATTYGNFKCDNSIVYQQGERLNYCRTGFDTDGTVVSNKIVASTPNEEFAVYKFWYSTSDCSGAVVGVSDITSFQDQDFHGYGTALYVTCLRITFAQAPVITAKV